MTNDQDERAFKLKDIEAALSRAAARARKLAAEYDRPLVLYENGRIVKLIAREEKAAAPAAMNSD